MAGHRNQNEDLLKVRENGRMWAMGTVEPRVSDHVRLSCGLRQSGCLVYPQWEGREELPGRRATGSLQGSWLILCNVSRPHELSVSI